MSTTFKGFLLAGASAMTLLATAPIASAGTYIIDFTALPLGTSVTTFMGGTVALEGTFDYGGPIPPGATPSTGPFGYAGLGNSPTENYPTANGLEFTFTAPVKDVSFTFDNFGSNYTSYFLASNGSTGGIGGPPWSGSFSPVSVAGTLTSLTVDNGEGASRSWLFGVGTLTYTTAVPEPATWALMMSGFGGIALLGYLRRHRPVTKTA